MGEEVKENSILALSGSPRKNGNSDTLAHFILEGAATADAECTFVSLGACDFKGCIGCERCRKDKKCTGLDDDMLGVYQKIIEVKGLVLVGPVHNDYFTAWMKAFFDRLYCFYQFVDLRPAASWS